MKSIKDIVTTCTWFGLENEGEETLSQVRKYLDDEKNWTANGMAVAGLKPPEEVKSYKIPEYYEVLKSRIQRAWYFILEDPSWGASTRDGLHKGTGAYIPKYIRLIDSETSRMVYFNLDENYVPSLNRKKGEKLFWTGAFEKKKEVMEKMVLTPEMGIQVINGVKLHQLEKTERKGGDPISFHATNSTDTPHRIWDDVPCMSVQAVEINRPKISVDGVVLDDNLVKRFIRLEGFRSADDFWKTYREPFSGFLTHWTPYRY